MKLLIALLLVYFPLFSIVEDVPKYLVVENTLDNYYPPSMMEKMHWALDHRDQAIRIASFNMLFTMYDKNLPKKHRWSERKKRVVAMIRKLNADLIGSQELFKEQLADVLSEVGDTYAFFGKSHKRQGKDVGEINGIFYRKERFELVDEKCIYTDAPQFHGQKTIILLILRDKKTGKEIVHLNTHLAFRLASEREAMTKRMIELAKEHGKDRPVVITGDFNYFDNRPDLNKLPARDGNYNRLRLTRAGFFSAQETALFGHIGPIATFTNDPNDPTASPFKGDGEPGIILDYIMTNDKVEVLIQGVENSKINGEFPSDHMPIFADLICL